MVQILFKGKQRQYIPVGYTSVLNFSSGLSDLQGAENGNYITWFVRECGVMGWIPILVHFHGHLSGGQEEPT